MQPKGGLPPLVQEEEPEPEVWANKKETPRRKFGGWVFL
jgi:hypothetical protein